MFFYQHNAPWKSRLVKAIINGSVFSSDHFVDFLPSNVMKLGTVPIMQFKKDSNYVANFQWLFVGFKMVSIYKNVSGFHLMLFGLNSYYNFNWTTLIDQGITFPNCLVQWNVSYWKCNGGPRLRREGPDTATSVSWFYVTLRKYAGCIREVYRSHMTQT